MPTCLHRFHILRLAFRRWRWGVFVSSWPTGLSNSLTGILPNDPARLPEKSRRKFTPR
jgi:hypothetical protein